MQDILAQEIEFRLREIRIDQRQYGSFELPKQTSAFGCGLQAEQVPVLFDRTIAYLCLAADIVQHFGSNRAIIPSGLFVRKISDQVLCYGNLVLRRFAEAHADGVAYPVSQQRTDTNRRFDSSIFAFAGLGHTEVEWEGHMLFIHGLDEQAHGINHDAGVRGFDGDDNLMKIMPYRYAQKLHDGLHHSCRRVAITAHDTVAQGAMVDTQTNRRLMLAADVQ